MPASVERLTSRQLNRATLARQMLLERADINVEAAVARLIGLQAQEPKPPFIGLWTRLNRFHRHDLRRALHERSVVRGTLMRGTLHLFNASDYAAYRLALQPVLDKGMKALGDRAAGLDPEQVLPAARTLLQEHPRTFNDMRTLLQEAFPEVNERALGFTVRMMLPLVMVPTEHPWSFPANAAFTLAEAWIGTPLDTDDAVPELIRRYLAAFGPATTADAQTWCGLPRLKPVFEAMRPNLVTFTDEQGRELFDLPEAPRPDADTPAPVRFLPEFDNLLLSHADRTRVIADEHRNIVYRKGNLRLLATIVVDGVVSGTWRTETKRKAATLEITPFAPLAKGVRSALEEEGETLLRFIEEDAKSHEITFAT